MYALPGRPLRLVLLLIGCALICGCGKQGPERVPISGTIAYQGQPLEEGSIRFVPIRGTQAPVSITPIVDGRYAATAHGGVAVGTYKIEIMAYRANKLRSSDQGDFPGAGARPPVTQFIPKKYNAKTELEITVPSGSGEITKDFDLTD